MKKTVLTAIFVLLAVLANAQDTYFGTSRVLIAYFSWSGNTQRVAEQIQSIVGGDLFRIEPVTPYPTDYTECTEVALAERDSDARPAIASTVDNFDDYDIVFIGCPVWWHTAPMIISTFAESYDFTGKTVVPFCTYASTYRDETLQKIVDLTPDAAHLEGFGSRSGQTSGVQAWIDEIYEAWLAAGGQTGIDSTVADAEADDAECYNMAGQQVDYETVQPGVYIVREGDRARKVLKR